MKKERKEVYFFVVERKKKILNFVYGGENFFEEIFSIVL